MRDTLRRFGAAFRMELRLLCLHWSYLALHVAWALLLWWQAPARWSVTAHVELEGPTGRIAFGLVSLIALFVGASSASRSQRSRFAAMEDGFPTGGEGVVGRWLAGLVGLMGALVEPLALAYLAGPTASWLDAMPLFLLEAVISFGFCSALAWVVTLRSRNTRWVYPVLAGFWVACFAAPLIGRTVNKENPYLSILDFMRYHADWYSELWGRVTAGPLPFLLDSFYVGLTLLLLGSLVMGYRRGRLLRPGRAAWGGVILGLILAGSAGTAYLKTYADWSRLADEDVAYHDSVTGRLTPQAGRMEDVERYDVTADLSDPAHPTFTAKMTLHNQGQAPLDSFALTLNRSFLVTESSLPVERDGDFLTVKLDRPMRPGESRQVSLQYGGQIWMLQRLWGNTPRPVYYTAEQGVRLPPSAGWYPIAGRQWLKPNVDIFSAMVVRGGGPVEPDTYAFHLEVRGPEGWGVLTNLTPDGAERFNTERTAWVMLFASPRVAVEQSGSVVLAAARDDIATLRTLTADYQKAADYLTRFFPGAQVTGMTLAILDQWPGIPDSAPPAGGRLMAVFDRWTAGAIHQVSNYDQFFVGRPVVNKLWAMTGGQHSAIVDGDLSLFLWAHYQANGDPDRTRQLVTQPGYHHVAMALCDVLATQGDDGVIRVIQQMRGQTYLLDPMESVEQAAWVKEAASGAH